MACALSSNVTSQHGKGGIVGVFFSYQSSPKKKKIEIMDNALKIMACNFSEMM
jgi:hypothetical protein